MDTDLTPTQRDILRTLADLPLNTAALIAFVWWNVSTPLSLEEIAEELHAMIPLGLVTHANLYWTVTAEGRQIGQES